MDGKTADHLTGLEDIDLQGDGKDLPVHLEHLDRLPDNTDLSEAQRTLAFAGDNERAKNLGTFSAIKYYWVAFLWAQYFSLGAALVGYDGTVSRLSVLYATRSSIPAGLGRRSRAQH